MGCMHEGLIITSPDGTIVETSPAAERILEAPDRWRITREDVRHYLAHKFPYAILYTIEVDSIVIVAVAHGSREPGYWKHRLK